MKNTLFFAFISSFFIASASASEWNNFVSIGTEEGEYFFDAASVRKTSDSVNLWVKIIQKNKADFEGSWASSSNLQISCAKRTIRSLSRSTYRANGDFIRSNSYVSLVSSIDPDSPEEGIFNIACMADFPKITPTTKNLYFKLLNNDPFASTLMFNDSKIDKAPK